MEVAQSQKVDMFLAIQRGHRNIFVVLRRLWKVLPNPSLNWLIINNVGKRMPIL
jgi:hypothetical protein